MEDYTYHLGPGEPKILGAHMLEVCPTHHGRAARLRDPSARDRRPGGPGPAGVHASPGPGVVVGICGRRGPVPPDGERDRGGRARRAAAPAARSRGPCGSRRPTARLDRELAARRRPAPHRPVHRRRTRGAGGLRADRRHRTARHRRRHHRSGSSPRSCAGTRPTTASRRGCESRGPTPHAEGWITTLRPAAGGGDPERLVGPLQRIASRHEGGQVDTSGLGEPRAPLVDVVLHPPQQGKGEALAARERGGEGRAVVGGDTAQHDTTAGADQVHRLLDGGVVAGQLEDDVHLVSQRVRHDRVRHLLGGEGERAPRRTASSRRCGERIDGDGCRRAGCQRGLEQQQPDRTAADDGDGARGPQVAEVERVDRHAQRLEDGAARWCSSAGGSGCNRWVGHAMSSRNPPSMVPWPANPTSGTGSGARASSSGTSAGDRRVHGDGGPGQRSLLDHAGDLVPGHDGRVRRRPRCRRRSNQCRSEPQIPTSVTRTRVWPAVGGGPVPPPAGGLRGRRAGSIARDELLGRRSAGRAGRRGMWAGGRS